MFIVPSFVIQRFVIKIPLYLLFISDKKFVNVVKYTFLPTWLRGCTPDFRWRGWWNGGKNQNIKKSFGLPTIALKKIPGQTLTPKNSHDKFLSLRNFQKEFLTSLFVLYLQNYVASICKHHLVLDTPENTYLHCKLSHLRKYLPKVTSRPNKISELKISNPKKSFDHVHPLKSRVPPWGTWLIPT